MCDLYSILVVQWYFITKFIVYIVLIYEHILVIFVYISLFMILFILVYIQIVFVFICICLMFILFCVQSDSTSVVVQPLPYQKTMKNKILFMAVGFRFSVSKFVSWKTPFFNLTSGVIHSSLCCDYIFWTHYSTLPLCKLRW